MLPVPHFHAVFTLPAHLRMLCKIYPAVMYDLLLRSCGDVLIELGKDTLGAYGCWQLFKTALWFTVLSMLTRAT